METLKSIADAFKIPLLTAVLTIGGILIKEWFAKRKRKEEKDVNLIMYSVPIIHSAHGVFRRIHEIFTSGYEYLDQASTKNKFNNYKYVSSIYRTMSLIGWTRAVEKELTYLELSNEEQYKEVELSINNFKSTFADGEHVELERLNHICNYWNLDISDSDPIQIRKLGTEFEKIMWKHLEKHNKNDASDLPADGKTEMNNDLIDSVQTILNKKVDKRLIESRKDKVIGEINRIESWIYRDWLKAIGDYMLLPNKSDSKTNFEIMSFGEFEDNFDSRKTENKHKWIIRVEAIFENLKPAEQDRYDSRLAQLKNIASASLDLMECFNKIDQKKNIYSQEEIKDMRKIDMNLNTNYYVKSSR